MCKDPGPHSLLLVNNKIKDGLTWFDPDLTYRGIPHDPGYPVPYCTPLVRQPVSVVPLSGSQCLEQCHLSPIPELRLTPNLYDDQYKWGPLLKLISLFMGQMWYYDFVTVSCTLKFYLIFQNQNAAGNVNLLYSPGSTF